MAKQCITPAEERTENLRCPERDAPGSGAGSLTPLKDPCNAPAFAAGMSCATRSWSPPRLLGAATFCAASPTAPSIVILPGCVPSSGGNCSLRRTDLPLWLSAASGQHLPDASPLFSGAAAAVQGSICCMSVSTAAAHSQSSLPGLAGSRPTGSNTSSLETVLCSAGSGADVAAATELLFAPAVTCSRILRRYIMIYC